MDFSFEPEIDNGEIIIAKKCTIFLIEKYNCDKNCEIIDFSNYNFDLQKGIIVFAYCYMQDGVNSLEIIKDTSVIDKQINDAHFFMWIDDSIQFTQLNDESEDEEEYYEGDDNEFL